jgi:hypothetical protein
MEPAKNSDILVCRHFAHNSCVQKWADTMQDEIVGDGYPALLVAKCPICRADQPNIHVRPATWIGSIELTADPISSILELLVNNNGWISSDNIPNEIKSQMPDASNEEQLLITNCLASQLWMLSREKIPHSVILIRISSGHFMTRCLYSTE